jgi:hypothetical protein
MEKIANPFAPDSLAFVKFLSNAEHEQLSPCPRAIRASKREENSGINWPGLLYRTMIGGILWGFAEPRNGPNSSLESFEDKEKTIIMGLSSDG